MDWFRNYRWDEIKPSMNDELWGFCCLSVCQYGKVVSSTGRDIAKGKHPVAIVHRLRPMGDPDVEKVDGNTAKSVSVPVGDRPLDCASALH